MSFTRTTAAAVLVSATTLGGFALAAHAETGSTVPCAAQQAQVTKAQDALTRVTAVFAHQKQKNPKSLAHASQAKKAQQQRLKEAQARLDACLAAQPTPAPTDTTETTDAPTDAPTDVTSVVAATN
jgi:uncharacterized membrane protein